MHTLVKSFSIFVIFAILGMVSLYGVLVPDHVPVATVGAVQLAALQNGLSLSAPNSKYYYTLSPYNDYVIGIEGIRNAFITKKEIENNSYTTTIHASRTKDIFNTITSYFFPIAPTITYKTSQKNIRYNTEVDNSGFTITSNAFLPQANPLLVGITFPYHDSDFVYDTMGTLFTYKNENDLAFFKQSYNISLSSDPEDVRVQVPSKKLFIVNPSLPAVFVVQAYTNQTMWINRNLKLIEIEEIAKPQGKNYQSSIRVDVYPNPKEAQKSL